MLYVVIIKTDSYSAAQWSNIACALLFPNQ